MPAQFNIHISLGEMEKREQQIPSEWSHAWATRGLTWPVLDIENGVVPHHVYGHISHLVRHRTN